MNTHDMIIKKQPPKLESKKQLGNSIDMRIYQTHAYSAPKQRQCPCTLCPCPSVLSTNANKAVKHPTTLNSNEQVRNPVSVKHIGREGHLLQAIGSLAPYHQR